MSPQLTSPDSPNATFSRDSADGHSPFVSPDGRIIDPHGLAAALVSLSARQVKALGLQTSGIYGPPGSTSSRSVGLQSSLESRLRQRLIGSVSCSVTWKAWATPWGACLSRPRAQVRSITGTAISLWPTMTSNAPARNGHNEAGNSAGQVAIRKILLALWPTARASDGAKGGPSMTFGAGGLPLPSSAWRVANTSSAPTENSPSGVGSLHPEFAGWELGYPPEWLSCAPSETQSIRARQRHSSSPTPKPEG